MPSAFSMCLKSLSAEIVLGEGTTPTATEKKRKDSKQDTPAKKRREHTVEKAVAQVLKANTGGATGSSAPAPEAKTKPSAKVDTKKKPGRQSKSEKDDTQEAWPTKRSTSTLDTEGDSPPTEGAEPKKGRQKKPKPEGPYTKFKDEGSIPEPSIIRKELPAGAKGLKAISWNLGGLRGFARNRPDALPELVKRERPDILGIMEHKLQEGVAETESAMTALLESLPDYETAALHCSTAKKGYSGTLFLLHKEAPKPLSVECCDLPSAKDEGRLIIMELEELFLVLAYVPNSGEGLKRLDDRIGQWDVQLREKLQELAAKKPTVLLGDLNVAHRDEDIWNVEAPHVPKSAGTTQEERDSFSSLLGAGFVDGFAQFHPEALGAFTYWSIRAGNRPKNRGLRLDYGVASRSLLALGAAESEEGASEQAGSAAKLVDVFHLQEMSTGDHCPVGVLLSL